MKSNMLPTEQLAYNQPYEDPLSYGAMPYIQSNEGQVANVLMQIDPATILDNLDHALRGEQWDKEKQMWVMNVTGKPLVNDLCRSAIINYLTPLLTNVSTMGIIDDKRLSLFMEGVISAVKRMFVTNLEAFGFVPPSPYSNPQLNDYYNRGIPDSARMNLVSDMIYRTAFLVLSRSVKGVEHYRAFKSYSIAEQMGYANQLGQQQQGGLFGKLFGRK